MSHEAHIRFENVSKFYGEVLGVNRVELDIPPGVTSLVGPNGSGKTTLMNLMTGLIRPTRGAVHVLGIPTHAPEQLFRRVGYCSQFDAFPPGTTGRRFIADWLTLHGFDAPTVARLAIEAIDRVGLTEAADRRVAAYSKGMRQRIHLALALSHHPKVLVLDEPLNGLDPMARSDALATFQSLGREGHHVIVSSHVLQEVDRISDQVILLSQGYVMAEGRIPTVRNEVTEHPMQLLVRCAEPSRLATRLFAEAPSCAVVEAKLLPDGCGLLVRTRDVNSLYRVLQDLVLSKELSLESVAPADDDTLALYQYLIGTD